MGFRLKFRDYSAARQQVLQAIKFCQQIAVLNGHPLMRKRDEKMVTLSDLFSVRWHTPVGGIFMANVFLLS